MNPCAACAIDGAKDRAIVANAATMALRTTFMFSPRMRGRCPSCRENGGVFASVPEFYEIVNDRRYFSRHTFVACDASTITQGHRCEGSGQNSFIACGFGCQHPTPQSLLCDPDHIRLVTSFTAKTTANTYLAVT